MEVERLIATGKQLGYASQELQEWVDSERSRIKGVRARERVEKAKEGEDTKETAEKRIKNTKQQLKQLKLSFDNALQGMTAEEVQEKSNSQEVHELDRLVALTS